MAPAQSTGQAISVLQGWLWVLPSGAEHAAPPLLASIVMTKTRVATPFGPQGSEQSLSSSYAPTQPTGGVAQATPEAMVPDTAASAAASAAQLIVTSPCDT
jgi:hypothetical protein